MKAISLSFFVRRGRYGHRKRRYGYMKIMDFEQFCSTVLSGVSTLLGETAAVSLRDIGKNNGVTFRGILISSATGSSSPAVYMEGFYEDYKKGRAVDEIAGEITQVYRAAENAGQINMDFFLQYEKVRERVCYKLVHFDKNKELLKKIPHKAFLDLAIVFYYAYENEALGKGSILIYEKQLRSWGITEEELYRDSMQNTPRLFPAELMEMRQLLNEFSEREECAEMLTEDVVLGACGMYVLTNQSRQFGAAAILYAEELKRFAGELESSLIILPSSVHEVILIPDTGKKYEHFKGMVEDVNASQVEPEEVLSDSVYFYDRETDRISRIG